MTQHRIGIDLGGTKIEIIALGPDGTEVMRHRIPTPHGYHDDGVRHRQPWCATAEAQLGVTATVGIGIPGVISPATGLVKNANSIALNGHRFDHDISQALDREVRVENDANCFALSEATRRRRRRLRRGVRRDPGHRLRRRHRRRRQGSSRAAPRRRRMGPHAAALADGLENPRPALLVRQARLSGNLRRRSLSGARLRRTRRPRRQQPARPGGRRRSGARCRAGAARRPAGARPGRGDQHTRSRRDRAGRRPVEHGPSLHGRCRS